MAPCNHAGDCKATSVAAVDPGLAPAEHCASPTKMSAMSDMSSTTEIPYADGKILKHTASGVGVITFNNPDKRNAMSLEMWEGFGEALTALRDDATVRVVILRGGGGKAFVSGADISQFEKTRHNAAASEEYAPPSARCLPIIPSRPLPASRAFVLAAACRWRCLPTSASPPMTASSAFPRRSSALPMATTA